MVVTPTLAATAAPLRPVKLGLPLRWLLLRVVGVAVVANLPLLQLPMPALVAWVTQLGLRAVKPLVAPRVARAWVAMVGPTRPLPRAQEPAVVEVGLTLPLQAELAALVATRVAEAVVAGLRSTPWPRALVALAASGWLSSFPMQSEEQNA